jgi:hypothetical protein
MDVTNKELDFINDPDLRRILLDRLAELDRIFQANAHYSTVFVSIGIIEGIFKYLASIYRSEIKSSATYPTNPSGTKKDFAKLTLDELYIQLKTLKILPDIDGYEHMYKLFRNYRNCIHPQAQVTRRWEIEIGQAQMALGLLNSTIHNLDRNIFIDKFRFEKIAGNPYYESNKELHLRVGNSSLHSFLALVTPITNTLRLTFSLDLPKNSLLNFAFNFVNDSDFKMVRLDSRANSHNDVLRSSQKYMFNEILLADPRNPPDKEKFSVEIKIDFSNRLFEFSADGAVYTFKDAAGNARNLFDEIESDKRVGFFNEVGPAKLSNVRIEIP